MSSILWYCSLLVIGFGILFFTMYKKRNFLDIFSFFSFASTLGVFGEIIILFLFQAYSYKPGIYTDLWAENVLGHTIPNVGLWASTAVLVAAYSLSSQWIVLISVFYMTIEIIFLKLGIYQQYWWRTFMTGIAVFVFYTFVKIWYHKLREKQHRLLRYITFFGVAWGIIHLPVVLLLLLGKQYFTVGWFAELYRDSTVFSTVYNQCIAAVFVFFICILNKWYWKPVPVIFFSLSDIILMKQNILIIQDGWSIYYLILIRTIALVTFILLEKYSLN